MDKRFLLTIDHLYMHIRKRCYLRNDKLGFYEYLIWNIVSGLSKNYIWNDSYPLGNKF